MHCASNGLVEGGFITCIFGLTGSGSECYGMVSACVLFDTLEACMHWRGTFGSFGLLFSFILLSTRLTEFIIMV